MSDVRRRLEARQLNAEKCPDVKNHTPCPTGYIEFMEWAEKKSRTHEQVRCPTCGLFAIWRKQPDTITAHRLSLGRDKP